MSKSAFKVKDKVELTSDGRSFLGTVQEVDAVFTTVKFSNGNVVSITHHLADNILKKVK